MTRVPCGLLLCAALGLGPAAAANLNFSLSTSPTARAGVAGLDLAGGTLDLGVSNRALDARFSNGLDLPAVGSLQAGVGAALAYGAGVRLNATADGALGPLAVNAALGLWTAPAASVDPLSVWDEAGTDPSGAGARADLTARYRLNRTLVLTGRGVLGYQQTLAAGLEVRSGGLTYRGGIRGGSQVFGLTAGVTLPLTDSATLSADALLGPHSAGVVGSLNIADALGDGTGLRLYAAYEPWRTDALPTRYGASATLNAGPGTLGLGVQGGTGGVGVRAAYSLPLGGSGE